MRIISKNSGRVIIVGLVLGLGAIPLYSYAIDYTSSGSQSQGNSGYTAGSSDFEESELYKSGLKKNIREQAENEAQNAVPPDVSGVTDDAIAHANAVEQGTSSQDNSREEEQEPQCTDDDRKQALALEAKFKELDAIIEENKRLGAEINGLSETSITQSKLNTFNRALTRNAKKLEDANIGEYAKLYKNCDFAMSDAQVLAPLRAALSFGR